jgi:hypothetical protein
MLKRRTSITALLAVTALVAPGCGSGGSNYEPTPAKPAADLTFQPGDELSMFPLAVGNQWTYSAETTQAVQGKGSGTGKFELTLKVIKVTPIEGGNRAEIEVVTTQSTQTDARAGSRTDRQVWDVTNKGIYQLSVGQPPVPFEPSQPNLLFPPDAERKFSYKGTGITPAGGKGTIQLDCRILPMQRVDTENESYPAIPVESKGTFQVGKTKGQMASMAYWSPKIGLVRFRQELAGANALLALTLKLKAKTVR